MRAIVVTERGGPEVLTLAERPRPVPGPGEVLVRIAVAGVNYHETYERSGLYPRRLPYVPGKEAAGTVVAWGEGVTGFEVGDRVCGVDFAGPYAEFALVPAGRLVPVPPGLSLETTAAVLLQGLTAHFLTAEAYRVRPGDSVLVHAAAGGTGLILTQVVTLMGGRVIGTVSTVEKEELARAAGAVEVVRYSETDVVAEVRRLTDGTGVSAVYDGVGKATFHSSLACLRRRGTLVLYGQASGLVSGFQPQRLAAGSLTLIRPMLPDFIVADDELRHRAAQVFTWVARGDLNVRIGGRYGLSEAGHAHGDLQGRKTSGKLLLIPALDGEEGETSGSTHA
ncbi:quinone oxidoreductase family protein [Microbispora sp. H10670]|uniref:quinone oxidoreductase family protein n=1 Tax=Microbispora sp. H10670 TaxID=2729108 RepID=UPI0016044727|nr:quinone oxidoreductase [Microbispora sp. H10670]